MKIYKMWEVIKMLSENPKLKFNLAKDTDGAFVAIGEKGRLVWDGFEQQLKPVIFFINDEWKLIQQPVTWQEAFEAGLQGKRIKVEGQYLTYSNFNSLHYALHYLVERPTYFEALMRDKWYIEEDEQCQ
ncbi:MAG: hypothetical protein JM58_09630 [Peptococcaceae bacterium BICA1-8]|nr:MAG: hypothetical protein JM58_09630 [Peptococcaceae bacterium BICA1-8]